MLIGARNTSRPARRRRYAPSRHAKPSVLQTLEAVAGPVSQCAAKGSALSTVFPSAPVMQYLYSAPFCSPSARVTHVPSSSRVMGCAALSQPLKSPTRDTCCACGAQTAKQCRPGSTSWQPNVRHASRALPLWNAASAASEIQLQWFICSLRLFRSILSDTSIIPFLADDSNTFFADSAFDNSALYKYTETIRTNKGGFRHVCFQSCEFQCT